MDRVMRDRRQFEAVRQRGTAFDVGVGDDAQILGAGEEMAAALMGVLGADIALLEAERPPLISNPPDHAGRLLGMEKSQRAKAFRLCAGCGVVG